MNTVCRVTSLFHFSKIGMQFCRKTQNHLYYLHQFYKQNWQTPIPQTKNFYTFIKISRI